jgi:hypothetical protein
MKFMGQLFVTRKSRLVKVYCLPSWKQVPAAIEELFIDVGVPDPSLDFKVHFDGAGENLNSTKLLKRKYIVHFHHSEADYLLNYEHVDRCSDEYTRHFCDIYSFIFATLDIITVKLRIKVLAQIMMTTTHWKGC